MIVNSLGNKSEALYNVSEGAYDLWDRVRNLMSQPHNIVTLSLGFVAINLNVVSILAILRTRSGLTAHYRFIISLAVSDILVGGSVTLHIINQMVNPTLHPGYGPWSRRLVSRCSYVVLKALNTTSLNITLLNLMGMAIDHFLAILRPLHYPSLMNSRRATSLLASFWLVAIVCGFSDFLSGYPKYHRYVNKYNYCEFVFMTKYQDEYPLFAIAGVCLVVMTYTYVCMFLTISRRHQHMRPIRHEEQRNKKALLTTLLILGSFIVCWLPMCLFQIILIVKVKTDPGSLQELIRFFIKADRYLYCLLLFNAILDPIIYAVRMREVQFGYKKLFWTCYRRLHTEHRNSMEATHTSLLLEDKKAFQLSIHCHDTPSRDKTTAC